MIRANIYSLDPLPPEQRTVVHEGVEVVAAYMGHSVLAQELKLKASLRKNGRINPRLLNLRKMDKLVELHLLAVPLDPGKDEKLGYAGIGHGWAYVDTSPESISAFRTTVAHETAHAFGFVIAGSSQEDGSKQGHCLEPTCILHRLAIPTFEEKQLDSTFLGRAKTSVKRLLKPEEPNEPKYQYDFCMDCKTDLRNRGEEKLTSLRLGRIAAGVVF